MSLEGPMQFRRDVWDEYKNPLCLFLAGSGYEAWRRGWELANTARSFAGVLGALRDLHGRSNLARAIEIVKLEAMPKES